MSEIQQLRRLMKSARKLPWEVAHPYTGPKGFEIKRGIEQVCQDIRQKDADFIVAACNSIPALIAEIERLRAKLSEAIKK